ncbi:PAS domain S-box protein [Geobacter pelophilus]|uniref:histidine kinase n=1 Tax=Geoanaerobacter pelophilus TaxID=60036 RepID=A0AAW4L4L8_9BACT|nr:PAS domain-containing sensor histidine kinase [Geoanaerobacter pelophilus]MBT0665699.1 PAS domain S-box protein [Geoanaerobacter pelophilus]
MGNTEPKIKTDRCFPCRVLWFVIWCLLAAYFLQFPPSADSYTSQSPKRTVLVLYGGSTKLPAHTLFNNGLLPVLKAAGVEDSDLHQEYLDLQHAQGREYRHYLVEYLRTKYADHRFDAIILFQPDALDLMLQEGKELFNGTPIIAAVPQEIRKDTSARKLVQFVYGFDALTTLRYALALLPGTKEIIVISGPSADDCQHLKYAMDAVKQFEGKLTVTFLTNHPLPEILREVAKERDHAIILYTRLSSDSRGKQYTPRDVLTEISRAAKSPVFGLHDSLLGAGIVGGNLLSFKELGSAIARFSVDLINAKPAPQLSKVIFQKHVAMFDWAEMQRWGLDKSRLPKDRVLINYHSGFWEQYWGYAVIALLFLVAEASLIGYLIWSRRRLKKAETALRASSSYARSLIEASLDPLVTISKDGKIMDVNRATIEATGVPRERLIGTDFSDYFTDPECARIGYKTVWRNGMVRDYPLSLRHVSGRIMDVLYNAALYRDQYGEVLGVFAAARDISQQKQAEAALRESELRYRTVAEFTSDWEYWVLPDGTLRYMSPSCEQVSGYTLDEFYADPELLTRIIHPDDLHIYVDHSHAQSTDTGPEHLDFRIVTKKGEHRWIFHTCQSVHGPDGAPLGQRVSNRDITKRKLAEEKAARLNDELESRVRERTAELERVIRELEGFCYALSHEFRAPLARLEGFGTMMLDIIGEGGDEQIIHCAQRIVAASDRLRTVIDSLLAMNRISVAEMHQQNLNLSEMAMRIVSGLVENVGTRRVHISIAPDVTATGDLLMMETCLKNLLGNAVKYSAKSPEAAIEFGQRVIGTDTVYFVRDNGVGFDMAFIKNIFQPFCRLHHQEEFEGTGVGLATVHRIIEKHHGHIWVEAKPGEGATFFFTLGTGGEDA